MSTLAIVPYFDVLEDLRPRDCVALVNWIAAITFETSEEAFGNRVVPAVPLATHALNEVKLIQKIAEIMLAYWPPRSE